MRNNNTEKKPKISGEGEKILGIYRFMLKENLTRLEWEQDKFKIRIRRSSAKEANTAKTAAKHVPAETQAKAREGLASINSPMAGTFYGSPAPSDPPYVKEGDTVSAGQTVCIVEAMKSMNEIKADMNCRIREILIKNAEPVTAGQTLFVVEKV